MKNETQTANEPQDIPILLLLILCGAVALGMHALAFAAPDVPPVLGLDFRAFYTAGRIALHGGPMYDLAHQFAVQKSIWPSLGTQRDLLPFFNPPFATLPMALVAWLPPVQAFALWTLFETLILATLLRVLAAHLPQDKPRMRLAFLFGSLTFVPVLLVLLHGQLSLFLALCFAMAWKNFRHETARGDFCGGAWLALLAVKPQLLIVPLLLLMWKKRGRALLGMLSMLAILGAVSLLMVGPQGLMRFKTLLSQAATWSDVYGIHPQAMHSWRALVSRFLHTDSAAATQKLWLLGALVALVALLFSWRGAWQAKSEKFDLAFAQLLITATFCSAHLNAHDLSLWLVAAALILRATSSASTREYSRSIVRALPLLGYCAAWLWFVLMLAKAPIYQLTVLFQVFALVASTFHLRREVPLTSAASTRA